jgi:hypothetical protein
MNEALFGILGALIGAAAGFGGTIIGSVLQSRSERTAWIRARRDEAYARAILLAVRVRGRRSGFRGTGGPVIEKQDQAAWFDDLSELLQALGVLEIFCSDTARNDIQRLNTSLNEHVTGLLSGKSSGMDILNLVDEMHTTILTRARGDLANYVN